MMSIFHSYGLRGSLSKHNISHSIVPPFIQSGHLLGIAQTPYAQKMRISGAPVIAGGLDHMSAILGASAPKEEQRSLFLRGGVSVVCNITIPRTSRHHSMEENPDPWSIAPTFELPGITKNTINLGYSVPFYDQLYKRGLNWIQNHTISYKELHAMHYPHLGALTTIHNQIILRRHRTITDICDHMYELIPKKIFSAACIYLLLMQVQYVVGSLQKTLEKHYSSSSQDSAHVLVVSGGHAHDKKLMQLHADMLGICVRTYTPEATELRGNFLLAYKNLQSFTAQHSYKHNTNVAFDNREEAQDIFWNHYRVYTPQ